MRSAELKPAARALLGLCHAAVRAYVARQLAAGQITIDDLKGDRSNAHVARGADPGVETGDGVSVGAEGLWVPSGVGRRRRRGLGDCRRRHLEGCVREARVGWVPKKEIKDGRRSMI